MSPLEKAQAELDEADSIRLHAAHRLDFEGNWRWAVRDVWRVNAHLSRAVGHLLDELGERAK
jgi:hypothetical protein